MKAVILLLALVLIVGGAVYHDDFGHSGPADNHEPDQHAHGLPHHDHYQPPPLVEMLPPIGPAGIVAIGAHLAVASVFPPDHGTHDHDQDGHHHEGEGHGDSNAVVTVTETTDAGETAESDLTEVPLLRGQANALRSHSNGRSITLYADNNSSRKVGFEWINFEGESVIYFILDHTEVGTQETFAGHVWRIVDLGTGKVLYHFIAPESSGKVTLHD